MISEMERSPSVLPSCGGSAGGRCARRQEYGRDWPSLAFRCKTLSSNPGAIKGRHRAGSRYFLLAACVLVTDTMVEAEAARFPYSMYLRRLGEGLGV